MKKNVLLLILAGFFGFLWNPSVYSQELLVGGNMEDSTAWHSSQLDAQVTTTATFNYTDDGPAYGSGGCAHFTATTEANTDHKYAQYCIYQKVKLVVGETYAVKGAYKANNVANFWCEVRISDLEPEDGKDYKPYGEDPFINLSTWEQLKSGDDTTFQKDYTVPETYGSTGDSVDMYFVLKMGVWDYSITYDFLLDEISLAPKVSTGIFNPQKPETLAVFPNPAENVLKISMNDPMQNASVEILNILGQTVLKQKFNTKVIDVSNLKRGVYTIVIYNKKTKTVTKFVKK